MVGKTGNKSVDRALFEITPEIQHFADQPVRLGLRIRIAHPDQDQIALTNASNQLFVYGYRGFGDSLNDEFHMFLLSAAIRRLC